MISDCGEGADETEQYAGRVAVVPRSVVVANEQVKGEDSKDCCCYCCCSVIVGGAEAAGKRQNHAEPYCYRCSVIVVPDIEPGTIFFVAC